MSFSAYQRFYLNAYDYLRYIHIFSRSFRVVIHRSMNKAHSSEGIDGLARTTVDVVDFNLTAGEFRFLYYSKKNSVVFQSISNKSISDI